MIHNVTICEFEHTNMQSANDSTPNVKDNLQFSYKDSVLSPKLSCAEPRTNRKHSKIIQIDHKVNFVSKDKSSKCNFSKKQGKCEAHTYKNKDLGLLLNDKIGTSNCLSPLNNKLLKQCITQKYNNKELKQLSLDCVINSKKQNLYTGSKNNWSNDNSEIKENDLRNKHHKRLLTKRCLFVEAVKSVQISDKSIEKSTVSFKPEIELTSTQKRERPHFILAKNCPNSTVLLRKRSYNMSSSSMFKLKERTSKNLMENNNTRVFRNIPETLTSLSKDGKKWLSGIKPQEKHIGLQSRNNCGGFNTQQSNVNTHYETLSNFMTTQLELDSQILWQSCNVDAIIKTVKNNKTTTQIGQLEQDNSNRHDKSDKFQHVGNTNILDSNVETHKVSSNRIIVGKKKCSKLESVNRVKATKRHFEPISDDEQEEYVIEQFLSQTDVTDKHSGILNCLSETSTSGIHFENVKPCNYSKRMQSPQLVLQTENQLCDKNETTICTSGCKIKANTIDNNISKKNIDNRGMLKENKLNMEVSCKNKRNSSIDLFSPQLSLSELIAEEKKSNIPKKISDQFSNDNEIHPTSPILTEKGSQDILDPLSNNDVKIHHTSPILSDKRLQYQNLNNKLDLFSNEDEVVLTSGLLLEKSQNQSLNESLDLFGDDKIHPSSPVLSSKRPKIHKLNEMLNQFSNKGKVDSTSSLLSAKSLQTESLHESLDMFSNDVKIQPTSPVLKGKKSSNQSFKETSDLFHEKFLTLPILTGKKTKNQNNRCTLQSLNKNDKNALSKISDLVESGSSKETISLIPTQSYNKAEQLFYIGKQCLPLKLSTEIVSQRRHHTSENFIKNISTQFKVEKPDGNDIFIEEFPTQITLTEKPIKSFKKLKLENHTCNSDIIFSRLNINNTVSDNVKDFDIGGSLFNSSTIEILNGEFNNRTDDLKFTCQNILKFPKDLNFELGYKSNIIYRTRSESSDIIEDFTSQEKSDDVSTGDVIESQSSPQGSSSSTQVSESVPSAPVVKYCSSHAFSEQTNHLPLDSPEKKRNRIPKPGSLTRRMKRLLHFQRSMFCMWKHNGETNVTHNSNTLRVNKIWNEFGKVIIDCHQNMPPLGKEKDTTGEFRIYANILAIVEPSAANDVSENCTISIYPPWQSMMFEEIDLVVIVNVTRLQVLSRFVNITQPKTGKIEHKLFLCSCVESADTDGNTNCNFRLPLRGAELITSLYQVNKLDNPKFFQAGERSVAAAFTNSCFNTDLALELSICHQFRCTDKTGCESLNALAIDKNGDCCQIALKTPMEAETNGTAKVTRGNSDLGVAM